MMPWDDKNNIRGVGFLLCTAWDDDFGHLALNPLCLFSSIELAKYNAEQVADKTRVEDEWSDSNTEYEWTEPEDNVYLLQLWRVGTYEKVTPAHTQYTDSALVYWIKAVTEIVPFRHRDYSTQYAVRRVPLYACQLVDTEELT